MITSAQEYIAYLKEIQDSGNVVYTTIPSTEPRLLIDANTREISISSKFPFLAVKHDHKAETIYFEINRYFDDVDLVNHTCIIQFINKSKSGEISEGYHYVQEMDIDSVEGKIIFGWLIENPATKFNGDIVFSIRFYSIVDDKFDYNFNTKPARSTIEDTLQVCNTDDYLYPSEFEVWVDKIDGISNDIKEAEKHLSKTIKDTEQELELRITTIQSYLDEKVEEVTDNIENLLEETISKKDIAVEQANIATDKANAATEQAGIATAQAENASKFADETKDYSLISQSYAIGGTNTRDGEDEENSKYYYQQAKAIATSLGYIDNIDVASVEEVKNYLGI